MNILKSQTFKCFIIMLIAFLIDSIIAYFLPYNLTKVGYTIVPNLGMSMFILLVMTLPTYTNRFFFATVCGLYYCVVYSNSLVIYVFIYLLITFIRCFVYRNDNISFFEFMIFAVATIMFKEVVIYYLMRMTAMSAMTLTMFITHRFLETVLFNMIGAIAVYFIYQSFNFKIESDPFKNE